MRKLLGRRVLKGASNVSPVLTFPEGVHLGWTNNTCFWGLGRSVLPIGLVLDRISKVILDAFLRSFLHCLWHPSFYCPLSSAFITYPSQGSCVPMETFPVKALLILFAWKKAHALELFSLHSTLPQNSVVWPLLPESNGITLWMWNLTYRGEVFGCRADYIPVMLFFYLQGFGWKESTPTSAWQSSGPMLPSGPPCPW